MDERLREFLLHNHAAIMVTVRQDGSPHVARVTVGLVDGRIWSSGTQTRVRTRHLRTNAQAALCVLKEPDHHDWLGIEGVVTIHEGPDVIEKLLALRRAVGREPRDLEEFRRTMVEQHRLIYEFSVQRWYAHVGNEAGASRTTA